MWTNLYLPKRGSCYSHVLVENAISQINKVTGPNKRRVLNLQNEIYFHFSALHQCRSPSQFDKACVLFHNAFCVHKVPSVGTAPAAVYKSYLHPTAIKRNFDAGAFPGQNMNNCVKEDANKNFKKHVTK